MKYVTESLANALYSRRTNTSPTNEGYILEATSSFSSKLNDFISNVDSSEQKQIKNTLNAVYLWLKNNNIRYEEVGKATKGQYKNIFNKYGSSTMDQLTWRLKIFCPESNYPKFKFGANFRKDIEDIIKKDAANFTMDITSSDRYYANFLNGSDMVGVAIKDDSYRFDTTNNEHVITLFFKVVVPHTEDKKKNTDNDANHKKIISGVKTFVKDSRAKSIVTDAIDDVYKKIESACGGYIDGKKLMDKDGVVRISRAESPIDAVVWKIELVDSKIRYGFSDWVKELNTQADVATVYINGDDFYGIFLDSNYGIALDHEYGARHTEFVYVAVFAKKEDNNIVTNPLADSKGTSLSNKYCHAYFDKARMSISGSDYTDMINEPRFYTTKKKGVPQAWEALMKDFNDNTHFSDAMRIIDKYSDTNMYYGMD